MYARATTLQASTRPVQEEIDHYQEGIPAVREISGNRGAFLLVNRSAGEAISVTLWESDEAMQASRKRADELRQEAQESTGEPVDEYEVAVWEVG